MSESLVNVDISVAALIDQLRLSPENSAQLSSMIAGFNPQHGMRKVNILDVEKTLTDRFPEHLDAFQRFVAQIPLPPGRFAFIYQGYHALIYFRAASLAFPGLPLLEMGQRWTEIGMERFLSNPTYQMIRRACGDSFTEYCEITFRDDPFSNYGTTTLHKIAPRHYEIYLTETYSDYLSFLLPTYIKAVYEDFGVDGEVVFEKLNPNSFVVTLTWS